MTLLWVRPFSIFRMKRERNLCAMALFLQRDIIVEGATASGPNQFACAR